MKRMSALLLVLALGACDRLGIPDPAKEAETKDAEGKAVGGACRHSGRALEDCYALNPNAPKASVFAGWRDMNDYMVQNKMETVKPEMMLSGLAPKNQGDKEDAEASAETDTAQSRAAAKKRAAKADSGVH